MDRSLKQTHLGEPLPEKLECVPVEEVAVRMLLIVGGTQVISIFDFSFVKITPSKIFVYI